MVSTSSSCFQVVVVFVVVQSLSRVQLFVIPWTAACQASGPSPSPGACSNSCPLCWWCHPTISSSVASFSSRPQSFPASGSFLSIRRSKYWSFSFSISFSNEYSGFISFRIGCSHFLAALELTNSLLYVWQWHKGTRCVAWAEIKL